MSRLNDQASLDEQNPWPGLVAFTEASSPYFFGRRDEVVDLFRRIRREKTTLLFGQSGLGKTSILQAGVFPRLRREGFLPISIRLDYSLEAVAPSAQVQALLLEEFKSANVVAPPFEPDETLWEYFHRRDLNFVDAAGLHATPVLAFDQFEEVFTLGLVRDEVRSRCQAFLIELADLIEGRLPAAFRAKAEANPEILSRYVFDHEEFRIVIGVREDYLPQLESLRSRALSLGQNRVRLTRMDGRAALTAVWEPGRAVIAQDVARRIVRLVGNARLEDPFGLAEGGDGIVGLEIEPSLLSLFCRELNEKRLLAGADGITSDLLDENEDQIVEAFYERSFRDLPQALRDFVEDELVNDLGHRESMSWDRARAAVGQRGLDPGDLDELVRRRILHIEDRLGVRRVELIHDILTKVVEARRRGRSERRLADEREKELKEAFKKKRNKVVLISAVLLIAISVAGIIVSVDRTAKALRAYNDSTQMVLALANMSCDGKFVRGTKAYAGCTEWTIATVKNSINSKIQKYKSGDQGAISSMKGAYREYITSKP
jgi:hypothetical protein